MERLRSPGKFGAWFCGIALNVARKWLRQLRAERPGLLPHLPSAAADPAEAAEIADTAARVRAEAAALALALESVETPRPVAYRMAAGLVEATGARPGRERSTRGRATR